MPVVRNPQFYFKEGFCWSDINTTFLKCRIKLKSVCDVKSMSLFGLTQEIPESYYVSLINSSFISLYVDSFVNNTQTFQINDARQIPIIIPSKSQLAEVIDIFDKSVHLKKMEFSHVQKSVDNAEKLAKLQVQLDSLVLSIYGLC